MLRLSNLAILFFVAATITGSISGQEKIDFNRDIRPILSDKCIYCHGPDEKHRAADLRLDIEESAKDFAIAEHDPDDSALIERIETDDQSELMPPPHSGKQLTDPEKALLRRWIDEGAIWSDHWAYVQPRMWPEPELNSDWPKNWIDRFVLARMPQGVQPNSDADKTTLLRRLHFDLTGLPPTPSQVKTFLAASSMDAAYANVVDELLASPHFGERMAMYWLDLVRYADTVGYHGDQDHNISPYRDWVIQSLNNNMPFDQFTREQLAGDLLESPTTSQQIATGYNRLLQTTHEGGLQPAEYVAIYAADRVRNVSAVWMGGTLGCAQCHDHKYDPYTITDFYSMSAFFADIDDTKHFTVGTNALPTRRPPELSLPTPEQSLTLQGLNLSLQETQDAVKKASDEVKKKELQAKVKSLQNSIKAVESRVRRTMISVAQQQPRVTRVLPRGNWLDDSGPIVQPAIPKFMGEIHSESKIPNRLDLANWLTDAKDGQGLLTARVMVNRFWYLLNGNAIAGDLDDFGGQGTPPVAPKLLDNLAIEFVESGWDVKHIIRLIVHSRTYQQSSLATSEQLTKDPNNQWFARAGRYRLPAEMIRDNALLVSGLLVDEIGGPSSKPYQPAGYYRHLNFPPRKYKHDSDKGQYRRGVYVHWQRQFLHPMLKSLDAPTREECTAERARSNTPLAALTLLNDPSFVEAARVFADRILAEGGSDFESRIQFAYQWTLSRNANEEETQLLKSLYDRALLDFQANLKSATDLTSTGMAPKSPHDAAELAAWTTIVRAIFNLNENLTRN